MDDLSNKTETHSENNLTVFEVRSSDDESTLANDRFTKANKYHVVPHPIIGNPLTLRVDISFDEDEVIIEDWTSYDEDDVCAVKIVSSVTPKVTQADKSGQTSQKQGISFKKSPEPRVKNVVNTGKRVVKLVWDYGKRGNPEILLQDHAVVDSGCSSHMTGNKAYLSDYEDFNGGFVAFGSDPKGGKITGKDLLTKGFDVTRISMDLRMDRCSAGQIYSYLVYKHNMVAFLKKPNESVGFTEVVDFLKGTSLRTLANVTPQLVASIDSKEYIITEASVRSKLQLADVTRIHNLSDADIYAGLARLGYVTEGKLTFWKKNFIP
ncbi:hypothetical protein Tco_0696899 [Tanacetum coccineum]